MCGGGEVPELALARSDRFVAVLFALLVELPISEIRLTTVPCTLDCTLYTGYPVAYYEQYMDIMA